MREIRAMSDKELLEYRAGLTGEYQRHSSAASRIAQTLAKIKDDLKRRRNASDKPFVSDHAVLRYLERVHGLPVEEIRNGILQNLPKRDREGIFEKDGVRFILSKDKQCVATIVVPNKPES